MATIWRTAQNNGHLVHQEVEKRIGSFSLEAAADMLNVDVIYTAEVPDNASGMIVKRAEEDRARAYINTRESRQRQRFTLAHELGHYVERMIDARDREFAVSEARTTQYDLTEFYADQFAGALLMPEDKIRAVTPNLDDALAVSLAFDVSIPAAQKRLVRLQKQSTFEASSEA